MMNRFVFLVIMFWIAIYLGIHIGSMACGQECVEDSLIESCNKCD